MRNKWSTIAFFSMMTLAAIARADAPKPISPEEVKLEIPGTVIEVINELIKEKFENGRAVVRFEVIKNCVFRRINSWRDEWLNVESMYRAAGWKVEQSYGFSGLDEQHFQYFEFRK